MTTPVSTKAILPISAETLKLIAHLTPAKVGEVYTYQQLAEVCGRPWPKCYGMLNTARKRLLIDRNMHFMAVRGVGIKLANNEEREEAACLAVPKQHKIARRAAKELAQIDMSGFDPDRRRRAESNLNHNAILAAMTTTKANKAVQIVTIANGQKPDHSKLLDEFKTVVT